MRCSFTFRNNAFHSREAARVPELTVRIQYFCSMCSVLSPSNLLLVVIIVNLSYVLCSAVQFLSVIFHSNYFFNSFIHSSILVFIGIVFPSILFYNGVFFFSSHYIALSFVWLKVLSFYLKVVKIAFRIVLCSM